MNTSNLSRLLVALLAFLLSFLVISKLHSPSAAINALIAAVIAVLLFLIFAGYLKVNWVAVAAVAATLNIIWAVWHQEVRLHFTRPVLETNLFEPSHPFTIEQIGAVPEKLGLESYRGLFITVKLVNKGKRTAKGTEVHLTNIGRLGADGQWKIENRWMTVPLKWVLPLGAADIEREARRDLVPGVPYYFSLGSFGVEKRIGKMLITYYMNHPHQFETIDPGQHCFEVRFFNADADEFEPKYITLSFKDFSNAKNLKEVSDSIQTVEITDVPPWKSMGAT